MLGQPPELPSGAPPSQATVSADSISHTSLRCILALHSREASFRQNPTRSSATQKPSPSPVKPRVLMRLSPMAAQAAGGGSSAVLAFFHLRTLGGGVRPAAACASGHFSALYGGCRGRLAHSLVDSVLEELRSRRSNILNNVNGNMDAKKACAVALKLHRKYLKKMQGKKS